MNVLQHRGRQSWAQRWLIGSPESWVGVSRDEAPAAHQSFLHTHTHTLEVSSLAPSPPPPCNIWQEKQENRRWNAARALHVYWLFLELYYGFQRNILPSRLLLRGLMASVSLWCCSDIKAAVRGSITFSFIHSPQLYSANFLLVNMSWKQLCQEIRVSSERFRWNLNPN